MAALEGSYYQNFPTRQTVGVTLPVIESREPLSKKERTIDGMSSHTMSTGRGDRPHSGRRTPSSGHDRPQSRHQRPSSRGESKSPGSTPDRPSSALARGVYIMEHTDAKVNPEPVISEEAEVLLEEYLSPRKLRALTGVDDLDQVHYLEMKVDTRDTSLGNFGTHLPNLSQLKLSNSIISTVRDLGSCLDSLKVLWMARCGVEDLDGLPAMTSLRELYLAYNEVSDISPCSMLENLQILDLEGNNIDNLSQIHFLSLCSSLQNLTLEGNPVCVTPSPDEADPTYDYRAAVKSIVPQIKLLDDEPLNENLLEESKTSLSLFEDDWNLIEQMMNEGLLIGAEDNVELDVPARPGTSIRPTTGYRPGSALKPYTALSTLRPNSRASQRPGTGSGNSGNNTLRNTRPSSGEKPGSSGSGGSRPGTAANRLNSSENDTSDLTMGGVVCGNPSKALRARRGNKLSTLSNTPKLRAQLKHKPEHSYDVRLEDDENLKELLSELKEWKHIHQRKQAEIDASKAPQVLRIDHDEAEDVSGNEISTDEDDDHRLKSGSSSEEDDRLRAFRGAKPKHRERKKVPKLVKKPSTPTIQQQRFKSPASMRRMRQTFEESHEAHDDDPSPQSTPPTPPDKTVLSRLRITRSNGVEPRVSSPLTMNEDGSRPNSGPEALGPRKFKLSSPMEKPQHTNKTIDRSNPVIRASTVTPERITDAPRAGTSRAALMQAPSQLAKIRKGQLANVQLLPSRYPKLRDDDAKK